MAGKTRKSFKDIIKSRAGGYIGISVFFILLMIFYPGNNLITLIKTKGEIETQERQKRKLQIDIYEMNNQIEDLTTNRDTLEKFARENFHFAKPGEDVYLTE